MPTLSNPKLQLQSTAGSGLVKVTTQVTVRFNDAEENIIKCLNLKFKLASRVWSEDDMFNGGDDPMFALPTKTITKDGTYTFERTVPTSMLDEDWEGNDEFYAKFALQAIAFPMAASTRTPTQVGNY
ncbi:hypothetical protein [Piscinibacter gummiphilus]|uniref:Uncharacterized protein n=1 Tax=Piscinibacter gummiphilus TaxID=946333 RepID=A0ABZ0CQN4_9BURK|nr:hypothetical protein [Piscinibacter gummiphilus]WOB06831.1 hypothetical protein RXV79_18130 [Piscinibacter gummiphilus]